MSDITPIELQAAIDVADRLGDADGVAVMRAKLAALIAPVQSLVDESMAIPEGDHHG